MTSDLFLAIHTTKLTVYRLRKLECGWELLKEDGTAYHVERRKGQVSCDCPDWINRREPTRSACKHISSLTEKGLL